MKQFSFFALTGKSLLIWLSTNFIATFCYIIYIIATGAIRPLSSKVSPDVFGIIIAFGLAFSFPVNFFLIPGLYILGMLRHTRAKVIYAIGIVLFLCLGVLILFFQFTGANGYQQLDIAAFLLPYIVGAIISFFVVSRKMIFSNVTTITDTTNPPEKL